MEVVRSFKTVDELRSHKKYVHLQYAQAFDTPQGEVVLEDLKAFCGFEEDAFTDDTHRTAYNLGLRKVFLYIMGMIHQTPEDLVSLTKKEE